MRSGELCRPDCRQTTYCRSKSVKSLDCSTCLRLYVAYFTQTIGSSLPPFLSQNMPQLSTLRRWAPVVVVLAAVFCVLMLAGPALAQDGGGEAPARVEKSVFVHIIESAGWIFSFALGIPSIALVALC